MIFNFEQQKLYTSKFLNALSVERNLSTKTLLAYRCDINGLLIWINSQNFTNLNEFSISSYFLYLQKDCNLQAKSIRRKYVALGQYFNFLKSEYNINEIFFRFTSRKFHIPRNLPKILSNQDIRKPLILINRQLDKQTKQMVCGYALGHYLEHQLLMDLHTLNKFLTIKDKHILLYEHNAFTSHLMLDSEEGYQMTKRGLDAAQISAAKRIHLNLVMVKLLELHHLGYDLRHYHAQHHAFIKQFNLPAHFQF